MNHVYRVLWNRALGRFCVTSEVGRNRSRSAARSRADHPRGCLLAQWVVGLALACSLPAWSSAGLPQGLDMMTGVAWVNTDPVRMTIRQELPKAILDWQSFNIGAGQQVIFEQPNAAAVALNRVIGTDASAIHGTLQANGRVFLVNPNGVLFGAGANVSVGGLVASTLKLSDQDFLAGRYQFSGPGSSVQGASIVNQGRISASDGGAVVLLGGSVSNQGTIAARLGSVALAAGNQVLLDFAGDGLLDVQVQQSAVNALVENRQLIQADGGSVLMTAKATDALLQTVVNNTGAVQARTIDNRSGKIVLLGGFDGGTTRVSGTLDASAPDGGDGGFVDTSGANVQIEGGTRVTTLAAQGKTGSWLIDPTDFTISAGAGPKTDSGIGADTLMANLAATEVTLQTLATGSEAGDIHVNAAVSWDKNDLTLNAHRNININALMSVNGEGKLALNYGGTQGNATATPVAGSNLNVNSGGRVDFAKAGFDLLAVNGQAFKVIQTLDDLSGINQGLNGKYALGRDIDASATASTAEGFAPIGGGSTPFTGVFDGLGHTISRLTINRPNASDVGLFGAAQNAVLRNIGLAGGSTVGRTNTGALVGNQLGGSISNAYATGSVTGFDETGGLVGANTGSISNAFATGSVVGKNYDAGGLVGKNGGSISNSYATGRVAGTYYQGGLVGYQSYASISNAYATGSVTGSYMSGGLVGFNERGDISNSYWNTQTTGQQLSAGGTGLTTAQMFDTSQWSGFGFGTVWGNASGQTTPYLLALAGNQVFNKNDLPTGAITSQNSPALYTAVLNVNQLQAVQSNLAGRYLLGNDIDASATAGWNGGAGFAPIGKDAAPFAGIFDGLGHAIRKLTINRPSEDNVGLFGYAENAVLRNIGLVDGSTAGRGNTGALVGSQGGGSISNAYATGSVKGNFDVGGLVGVQSGGSIVNAYASGSVTGTSAVGGLVGNNSGGGIINAYATASVTGNSNIGGLVGFQGSGVLNGVYATGSVSGASATGGLIGFRLGGSISNAYWNTETSGQKTSSGGTGLTTAQTFDIARWTGFDFVTVWGNANGQTTPYLLAMAGNQVFNRNDLPSGAITSVNRPALYTAILDVNQLQEVQNNLSGRYLLGNDIDASATAGWNLQQGFQPIGDASNPFNGIFDGLGHRISELTINRPGTNAVGLFGYARNATLRNVGLLGGSVTGADNTGSLVGLLESDQNGSSSITNAYATGSVTGKDNTGGLVGQQSSSIVNSQQSPRNSSNQITNAHATGAVTGNNNTGGLVGYQSGSVSNSFYGTSGSSISNAYATGNVTGNDNTGGLVGYQSSSNGSGSANSTTTTSIKNAYATGNVTGYRNVGGLVGNQYSSAGAVNVNVTISALITNAYATGNVNGTTNIGGLVGQQFIVAPRGFANNRIDSAYATGKVMGSFSAGGLVGYTSSSDSSSTNSFWDTGSTGQKTSAGGLGKTSEQMKQLATYANWDISNQGGSNAVWRIYEGETAPLLRSFLTAVTIGGDATSTYNGSSVHAIADYARPEIGDSTQLLGALRYTASSKNVGNYSGANLSMGRLYSTQQGYDISYAPSASLRILPKDISQVDGITAENRTYDGTTGVELHTDKASFAGLLAGDTLSVDQAIGNMLDKNAGDGKKVNITGITLAGDDASNYTLKNDKASTWVNIAKAEIAQVEGITAQERAYNSKTGVELHTDKASFAGLLAGDSLSVDQAIGNMLDKNAGPGKEVTISGITLTGDDAGNYALKNTQASTWVNIAKAEIAQVDGITAQERAYNSKTGVELHTDKASFAGLLAGDSLSVDQAIGNMLDKNAGPGKEVAITGITLTGDDAGNYALKNTQASTWVNIAKAEIAQVDGITAQNRIYDSKTGIELHTDKASFEGLLAGDSLSVDKASGSMLDKNAGDGKKVNITGITLAGEDAGNYALKNDTATTTVNIAKAEIAQVAGITAQNRIYDSKTGVELHTDKASFEGLLAGDSLSVDHAIGNMLDKNAGPGKDVTITGITLTGDDAGNYALKNTQASTWVDIARAEITQVEGITAQNRTYDGTTSATLNTQDSAFNGMVMGDELTVSKASASFRDKNADRGKDVDITGITLGGADARNYSLANTTAATKANIDKATISSVSGITAENRTYDGTTSATLNTQKSVFNGMVVGDELTVSKANASFRDKNADLAKDVDITGIELGGADAGNYSLANTTAATKANIDKATISSVSGITALNRTYDGTTSATLNTQDSGFNGMVVGDELMVSKASASFRDKNADLDKDVDISGIELGGADAGNYSLANTTATAKANIDKATISSVSGITALNRTYDGTTGATLDTQKSVFNGMVVGDELTVSKASASFRDKNADIGKDVDISGIELGGADAGNYSLANTTAATKADIDRLAVEARISADGKTYDASSAAVTHGLLGGVLGDDRVSLSTSGSFADKNAGSAKAVSVSGALGGADAGNYRLVHNETTTADIAQRAITASISADSKTEDGNANAGTRGSLAGVLDGDQVLLTTTGQFAEAGAGSGKIVYVSGQLEGADAGNYRLAHNATSSADILAARNEDRSVQDAIHSSISQQLRAPAVATGATAQTLGCVFEIHAVVDTGIRLPAGAGPAASRAADAVDAAATCAPPR